MRRTEEWLLDFNKRRAIQNCEPVKLQRAEAPKLTRGDTQTRSSSPGVAAVPIYALVGLCKAAGLPEPIPEYTFHPKRKWRADYCWPEFLLMLEVDGGIWTEGRHSRGSGRIKDMEKLSEAAILGYRVLLCTPEQVRDGTAIDRISRALAGLMPPRKAA